MKNIFSKKNRGFTPIPFVGNKNMKTRKVWGFTLLETLVAISILSLSIAGAFSVAQSGLSSAILARDQIVAFQLAQEAVEFVRNVRDNNVFDGDTNNSIDGWLEGIPPACITTGSVRCGLDITTRTLGECGGSSCKMFKNTDGYYVQSGGSGTPTPFTRRIHLERVNDNEIKVIVEMLWQKGTVQREFTVVEHLFNWQKGYSL